MSYQHQGTEVVILDFKLMATIILECFVSHPLALGELKLLADDLAHRLKRFWHVLAGVVGALEIAPTKP